jgi:hypothetical protein
MTLIVSLRIPDGIVIAGDSLATMMSNMQISADINVVCPDCGHSHTLQRHPVVNMQMPATTFSYAQKIMPMLREYGIGTFGQGKVGGKTIYYALREFEQSLYTTQRVALIKSVEDVATAIGKHIQNLLEQDLRSINKLFEDVADDWFPVGFHVVGYTKGEPQVYILRVGKQLEITLMNEECSVSGQSDIVAALFQMQNAKPTLKPAYNVFTLQDAIEYAKFLIQTTSLQQQFSSTIPTVGGDIDVALLTPFDKFTWIEQKPLAKLLGG